MNKILPGLYIGGSDSLASPDLKKLTNILSIINYEPPIAASSYNWKHIHLEDSEDANLLEVLPEAVDFVHNALYHWSSILVTCNAGVSRSVSVVMAYLMRRRTLSVSTALEIVREVVPGAAPNSGFLEQLQLWYDMGFRVDIWHPEYKRFSLLQFGKLWQSQGYVDASSLRAVADDASSSTQQVAAYRCRKCRRMLATTLNVVPVGTPGEPGAGRAQRFGPKKGQKGRVAADAESDDSSLFVEPLEWMVGEIVGASQGKLHCPGCGSRLGSFNWAGITNAAGIWVTPAFQLHLSRLDLIEPKQPAVLRNVRKPLFGAAAGAPSSRPPALPPAVLKSALGAGLPGATFATGSAGNGSLQNGVSHPHDLVNGGSTHSNFSHLPSHNPSEALHEQGIWTLFEKDAGET